jgi:hypothetical protein
MITDRWIRRPMRALCVMGLLTLGACASTPPPPPDNPPPPPPAAPVAEPAPDSPAPPPSEEAPQAAAQPECQAAEDCAKSLGAATAGHEWGCTDGHCAERAAPEPPKAEVAEAPAKSDKAKGKVKKKK